MLLDRRRSQEREGGAVPSSPSRGPVRSMPRLKLARGVSVRFSPTLASLDRAFPFCSPSLTERVEGGAEKPWKGGGVRSNCCEGGYAVTAVISSVVLVCGRERGRCGRSAEGLPSRTTASPMDPIPMPAPEAHSCAGGVSVHCRG